MSKKQISMIAMTLIVLACAPQRMIFDRSAMEKIIWPGQPEKPRIVYIMSILAEESSLAPQGQSSEGPAAMVILPAMTRPYNVFADDHDTLYIADQGNSEILAVDLKKGEYRTVITSGDPELPSPTGIVVFGDTIFISDALARKVVMLDREGHKKGEFRGEFQRPTSLALDKRRGLIYLSDTLAHKVYIYDFLGNRTGSIGRNGTNDGEFNFPSHLWVDKDSRLYVTDALNFRIQIFSSGGRFESKFGVLGDAYGELDKPRGVATDSAGNVYVVDSIKDTVKVFDQEGRLLLFFGEQGRDFGQFYLPSGIFIDDKHFIYVADTYNSRVQVFRYLGADGY